jgi:hypothetical protein
LGSFSSLSNKLNSSTCKAVVLHRTMTPTNVDKRKDRDDAEVGSSMRVETKRLKIAEVNHDATMVGPLKETTQQNEEQQRNETTTVGANELASAFALASLASMSPSRNTSNTNVPLNTIMTDVGYESRDADNDASSELEDQNNNAVPISPDVRSPMPMYHHHRRVTFSNDTKVTSRQTSRRLSLPPRSVTSAKSKTQQTTPTSRMVHDFSPSRSIYISHRHSPLQQRSLQNQSWMRQQQRNHMMQSLHHHSSPPSTLFLPPLQHARTPSSTNSSDSNHHKWICDFCNVASFETYEEACVHEESCRVRVHTFASHNLHHAHANTSQHPIWPTSPHHQHIHRNGLQQPFLSSPHHQMLVGGNSQIPPPPPPPPSMRRNVPIDSPPSPWNDNHTSRQHQSDDTDYQAISPNESPIRNNDNIHRTISTQGSVEMNDVAEGSFSSSTIEEQQQQRPCSSSSNQLKDGDSIISLDDMELVPPYVYFLMRQVETAHFTEADRFVARSKGPVGYSGFQCRHCHGHAGLGKYFPITAKSLSTNSTSQNIHSHLLKCRKVGPYIKEQLIKLKDEKSKSPRLEPGWRRIFFEKIWSRLHD